MRRRLFYWKIAGSLRILAGDHVVIMNLVGGHLEAEKVDDLLELINRLKGIDPAQAVAAGLAEVVIARNMVLKLVKDGTLDARSIDEINSHLPRFKPTMGADLKLTRGDEGDADHLALLAYVLHFGESRRFKKCDCGCELIYYDKSKNRSGKHFPGHGSRVRMRRHRGTTG